MLVNFSPFVHVYILHCTHAQLKHCRVGQTVRIISDLTVLQQLQRKWWHNNLFVVSEQEQIHYVKACSHYALNMHLNPDRIQFH